jgi:cysteine desulfurase
VELETLEEELDRDTVLLTVMHANNEVGTIEPVGELAALAHQVGAVVHTDAAQSAGKIPVDVEDLGVDLLSLAGHKIYGPKGIGALYVREGTPFEPFVHGAGHEGGRRSGTESALLAIGLGMACRTAQQKMSENLRIGLLRDRLWENLQGALGEAVVLQGHPAARLPNTLNVAFRDRIGSDLLARCPGLAASTGAACHGGDAELSDTLKAMGVAPAVGAGSIRLSLGRLTTEAEVDHAARLLIAACEGAAPADG